MTVQIQRRLRILLRKIFSEMLDILQLQTPVRLGVRTIFVLVCIVQRGTSEPSLIEREQRDTVRREAAVGLYIASYMFRKAVHEEHHRLRERCGVCPSVKLMPIKAWEPAF